MSMRWMVEASIAGLAADGPVEIDDDACVSISYPGFFDELAAVASRGAL